MCDSASRYIAGPRDIVDDMVDEVIHAKFTDWQGKCPASPVFGRDLGVHTQEAEV